MRNNVRWTRRVWEGFTDLRRTPVRFAFHLAVARLITQWRSLLIIIAGTILAASIGALVPLYTTAISQVGMLQRLDEQESYDAHVSSEITLRPYDWADSGGLELVSDQVTTLTNTLVDENLRVIDDWVEQVVGYGETVPVGIAQVLEESGDEVVVTQVRSRVAYYDNWEEHVRVVDGRLPQPVTDDTANDTNGAPVDMEIAISLDTANTLSALEVGTVINLNWRVQPDGDLLSASNIPPSYENNRAFTARIVGIVAPLDPDDAYWMARMGGLATPLELDQKDAATRNSWQYEFLALTSRASFFRAATEYLPGSQSRIGWRIVFAHDNLPFERIDRAITALDDFEINMQETFKEAINPAVRDAQQQESSRLDLQLEYHTQLTPRQERSVGILREYDDEVELLQAPFTLLLLQVGALVLFFLMVTAALVRRGERREIAMLQSRGALSSQIVLLRGIEALLICALAVGIAPLLARALLTALGPTIADTDDFPLPLTADVFAYAGVAATVTFLALMLTLRPVLRLPLVSAGGAARRSESQHWWQKYYLDAVLALVGLGALGLLVSRGSPLSDVNLGGQKADPLMLLAPALLFLALGSLALRFFPLMARLTSRVTSAGRGLLGSLASWQVSREPIHYGRITFLLALAIGIGWFATSFRATLANSHADQAQYKVGTDLRIMERDPVLDVNRVREASYYESLDDVAAASPVLRLTNIRLSSSPSGPAGDILAIDPRSFGPTLYWRSDLGPVYTPLDVNTEPELPPRGEELPFLPDRMGVWVRFDNVANPYTDEEFSRASVSTLLRDIDLYIRLLDADETWVIVPVEPVEVEYTRTGTDAPGLGASSYIYSGWVYYEADLTALEYAPQGPARLVSYFWEYRNSGLRSQNGLRLYLADMTLIDTAGTAQPFPVFSDQPWEFAHDRVAVTTGRIAYNTPIRVTNRSDLLVTTWNQEEGSRTISGVLLNYPDLETPLDSIVSVRVQEDNDLSLGLAVEPLNLDNLDHVANRLTVGFRPVESTEYYPSLFNRRPEEGVPGDSFMVVDLRELLYRLNRRPSGTYYPNEMWLRFEDGFDNEDADDIAGFIDQIDQADEGGAVVYSHTSLAEELDKLQTDPLGLGLLGLMYLAFIMALTLSVVGLLSYAGLTAQTRRTEFGILRALGLSSLRVVGGLALEQFFVMFIGIVLGALLGAVLADQVVPTLALGAAGEDVIPPFVIRVETRRLIEYGLMMAGVLLLVLSSSLLLVRQLSLSRTLRLGEE
ncbi:MAG: ABC transporter permease [Chloroflexi bacterium]|nr:ABC transporter permease [Chloroflexota bacterium]